MEQIEEKYNSKGMYLNEYQQLAMTTCTESSDNDMYALFGLMAEVGEMADLVAKAVRKEQMMATANLLGPCTNGCISTKGDGTIEITNKEKFDRNIAHCVDIWHEFMKELGDVLWFVALTAKQKGYTLEDVARMNLAKLAKRKAEGTIITHTDH